jgi:hypothetical protein
VSADDRTWLTDAFAPVSLEALNAKAAMLERLDSKYVVRADVLREAVPQLAENFDVLEIDGLRSFLYRTCYFDDPERRACHDHHQGRRRRMKVRVRHYVDADLCFVEVKLKDKRGITVKKRLRCGVDEFGVLSDTGMAHVERSHADLCGRAFGRPLDPVLWMHYHGVTLVAREGGERMTIDSGMRFVALGQAHHTDDDIFIVETKSANGNGLADGVLRWLHQHPTNGCSKYCVGMSVTGAVSRHNRFLPALRKLGAVSHAAH